MPLKTLWVFTLHYMRFTSFFVCANFGSFLFPVSKSVTLKCDLCFLFVTAMISHYLLQQPVEPWLTVTVIRPLTAVVVRRIDTSRGLCPSPQQSDPYHTISPSQIPQCEPFRHVVKLDNVCMTWTKSCVQNTSVSFVQNVATFKSTHYTSVVCLCVFEVCRSNPKDTTPWNCCILCASCAVESEILQRGDMTWFFLRNKITMNNKGNAFRYCTSTCACT